MEIFFKNSQMVVVEDKEPQTELDSKFTVWLEDAPTWTGEGDTLDEAVQMLSEQLCHLAQDDKPAEWVESAKAVETQKWLLSQIKHAEVEVPTNFKVYGYDDKVIYVDVE